MSIFDSFLSAPDSQAAFGDLPFVAAMLRFEAALAAAQAELGLIPAPAAALIERACDPAGHDVAAIVRDSGRAGSVAIPLVKSLRQRVEAADRGCGAYVHVGSTSQDVIDTAMALVSREVVRMVLDDLQRAAGALLDHAERHATTPMLARTLMQPASVTSFGFKCVGWAAPLVRARARIARAAAQALQVQLGGAVGTLAQMHGHGPAVRRKVAQRLGLRAGDAPWHTQRDEWVGLGCELGLAAGSLGKIATDIALMGQYEVGEAAEPAEPGRGGSSAMPHKRNPVASMVALAAAQRAPQQVAALLAAMPQAHERALGPWQAELAEWPRLLTGVHGSARALADALPGLQVHAGRMRANIDHLCAELPPDAAREWFDAGLAARLGPVVQAQVQALRQALELPKE